ncbi:CHASE3 domain-containing protein (plasmid) [Paraburkholderia sp. D15]|uniref:CHASE3 domain-containing protein n=1 Tax=Paraburkholderia sp. D15 TaxID=2880218 RepID=UPI002479E0E4|nr:CHASE3 domain-containing protein [Paraburkholderia sp. D15]WGS55296.1 CHASE3 domain-containing protein [Paraburkholderia sp. D15]
MAWVFFASATSFGYHRMLLAQRDWMEHTCRVMSTLGSILQRMTDAETGQRGYLFTSDKRYLAPYARAVEQLGSLSLQLRQLVRDSPVHLARVDTLDRALKDKRDELGNTIVVQDQEETGAARRMVLSNVGQERMDRIRLLIAQMRQTETELLLLRSDRAKSTERRMLTVTIVLAIFTICARPSIYFVKARPF